MRSSLLLALLTIAAGAATACGSQASPDGRDAPFAVAAIDRYAPSPAAIAGARYDLPAPIGPIALTNGVWQGEDGARVQLLADRTLVDDLYSDGGEEAVAFLEMTTADESTLLVVIVDVLDGLVHTIATTFVGANLTLRSSSIADGLIVVDVVPAAGGDSRQLSWRLVDRQLVRQGE